MMDCLKLRGGDEGLLLAVWGRSPTRSTPGRPEPMRACGNALQDRCFPTRPDISNIVTSGLPITA